MLQVLLDKYIDNDIIIFLYTFLNQILYLNNSDQ